VQSQASDGEWAYANRIGFALVLPIAALGPMSHIVSPKAIPDLGCPRHVRFIRDRDRERTSRFGSFARRHQLSRLRRPFTRQT
jgi:hypothetical protein